MEQKNLLIPDQTFDWDAFEKGEVFATMSKAELEEIGRAHV